MRWQAESLTQLNYWQNWCWLVPISYKDLNNFIANLQVHNLIAILRRVSFILTQLSRKEHFMEDMIKIKF